MRQLLVMIAAAFLALALVGCSADEEPPPPKVEPIKHHLDKANAAADAANAAAQRTDELSAAADGAEDDSEDEDGNP